MCVIFAPNEYTKIYTNMIGKVVQIDEDTTRKEAIDILLHQVLDHTAECIQFADASISTLSKVTD